jgi:hypothetical protein
MVGPSEVSMGHRFMPAARAAVVAVSVLALAAQLTPVAAAPSRAAFPGLTKLFVEKIDSVYHADESLVSAEGPATATWDGDQLVVSYNPLVGAPASVTLAPPTTETLEAGHTYTAFGPDPNGVDAGLQFEECTGGSFTVNEIDPPVVQDVPSVVTTFSASFSQAPCDSHGEIRLNASTGLKAYGFSVDFAAPHIGLGVDVDTPVGILQSHRVTLSWGGSEPVVLGQATLFENLTGTFGRGWSIVNDNCSGTTLGSGSGDSCWIDVQVLEWKPGTDWMYLHIPTDTDLHFISIRLNAGIRALSFVPIQPTRIVDTRIGLGISSALTHHNWRALTAVNRNPSDPARNVPPEALAIAGNLTITKQTSAGFASLTTIPTGYPKTSTINVPLGDTRANGVLIRLGPGATYSNGAVGAVWVGAPGSKADMIFDVTGYFIPTPSPASPKSGNYESAKTALRAVDSRTGLGLSSALVAGQTRTITFTLPPAHAGATAVAGNLTVVNPSAGGWVSIGPTFADVASTSAINFPAHDTRANNVVVPLGPGDTIKIKYSAAAGATTHILFDVTGTFGGTGTSGFVPLIQNRVLDTRTFNQPLYSDAVNSLNPFGRSTDPSKRLLCCSAVEPFITAAVVGNLTMINPTKAGFMTALGNDTSTPVKTSSINGPAGDVRANGVIVDTSSSWNMSLYFRSATGGKSHAAFDTTGYFVCSYAC